MDLFATSALRKRLHVDETACDGSLSPDPVRSWYGHVRHVGHSQFIVMAHAETRFTVVLEARSMVSVQALRDRWAHALRRTAEVAGLAPSEIAPLLSNETTRVATATDRRVLGTINDWFRLLHGLRDAGQPLDPEQLSHQLNDVPILGGSIGIPRCRFVSFVRSLELNDRRAGGPLKDYRH